MRVGTIIIARRYSYGPGSGKLAVDLEGDELPDLDAARERALFAARDLIAHTRSYAIRDWFTCSFEIEDQDAQLLLTVPFSDTVPEEEEGEEDQRSGSAHVPGADGYHAP